MKKKRSGVKFIAQDILIVPKNKATLMPWQVGSTGTTIPKKVLQRRVIKAVKSTFRKVQILYTIFFQVV